MKKSQLSASSYLSLKEEEAKRNNFVKNEDTKRGLKVAIIFLILAGVYALTIISTTFCMFLLA